jgi:NADH:ubiquinone oxidoreductase subunit E
MKACILSQIILLQTAVLAPAFMPSPINRNQARFALPEKVEVCGFKDCRRAGGGAKLEKMISNVLEEKNLSGSIQVEGCDCQGECGYGPNILVDGMIKNDIKTSADIMKALGIQES